MAIPMLVKVGITVVKEHKKISKLVLALIIGIPLFFVLVSAFANSFISALVGNELDPNFSIEESDIYKQVDDSWNKYLKDLEKRMDAEETRLKGEYGEEKVIITRNINNINYAYVLAYITWVNDNFKEAGSLNEATYDEDSITSFINQISVFYRRTITVEDQLKGLEGIEYTQEEIDAMQNKVILYNGIASPSEAAAFVSADERLQNNYETSFYLYVDWLGSEGIFTDGLSSYDPDVDFIGDRILSNNFLDVPIYYQNDYKTKYGNGTIASSGCAPTCIAMTFSYLLQKELEPDDVVAWTGNKYYVKNQGSSWSIFEGCADHWDVTCVDLGTDTNKVLDEVQAGHIVIASMGSGTFTKGGHFIVLTGLTEDGKFSVNDPNKNNVKKYQTSFFSCNLVFSEAKNFWVFY